MNWWFLCPSHYAWLWADAALAHWIITEVGPECLLFRLSQSANGATTNHPAALQLLSGCLDWALMAWALIYVFWQHLCIVFTRFETSLFISIQRGLLIEKEIRDCFLRIFLLFCAKLFHDFMKSFPRFLRNVFFFNFF